MSGAVDEKPSLIVVVDDDVSFREAVVGLLSSEGYRTQAFASAREYLRTLFPTIPDCLVVDVQMPGMSGLELSERLDAMGASTPVILVSAFVSKAQLGTEWRRARIIDKAGDPQILLEAIASALGSKSLMAPSTCLH